MYKSPSDETLIRGPPCRHACEKITEYVHLMHVKGPVVHVIPVICGNMVGDSQQGQPQLERVAVYHSAVSVWPKTATVAESSCVSLPCFGVAKDSHGKREQLYLTPLFPLWPRTVIEGESICI